MTADLTEREAADSLRVYPSWLAGQRRAGRVPHQMYGRSARYTPEQVEQIRRTFETNPRPRRK